MRQPPLSGARLVEAILIDRGTVKIPRDQAAVVKMKAKLALARQKDWRLYIGPEHNVRPGWEPWAEEPIGLAPGESVEHNGRTVPAAPITRCPFTHCS